MSLFDSLKPFKVYDLFMSIILEAQPIINSRHLEQKCCKRGLIFHICTSLFVEKLNTSE